MVEMVAMVEVVTIMVVEEEDKRGGGGSSGGTHRSSRADEEVGSDARPHVEYGGGDAVLVAKELGGVDARLHRVQRRELLLVACVRRKQPRTETPAAHLCADLRGEVGERGPVAAICHELGEPPVVGAAHVCRQARPAHAARHVLIEFRS